MTFGWDTTLPFAESWLLPAHDKIGPATLTLYRRVLCVSLKVALEGLTMSPSRTLLNR